MNISDAFRPLTNADIRDRIRIVQAAKARKGANLTRRELDELLGPDVETALGQLTGIRRSMARIKVDNFGVIGVRRDPNSGLFQAYAHDGPNRMYAAFPTVEEAVNQRNEWAERFWPGCDEAKCDMKAAKGRWKKRRRNRTVHKEEQHDH